MTGQHSALSTLVGLRVIHLARAPGSEGGRPGFEPGVSQPAHAMADGKLLLAYLPPQERSYLYQVDGLRSYTPNTITDPEKLEKELQGIRERGFAVDNCERFENTRGVAVPIFDLDDQPLLAVLCLSARKKDQDDAWLAQQMQSMAVEMSDHIALMGDMPKANTEFGMYNLE
jgi:IclR family acetate operon transcriptional repressor